MLNTVVLMGRLTAEPELKQTRGGISVVSFTVAIDRRYTEKDGGRQTDFINCVAWRQTAEFVCKYFRKGEMIALTGSMQTRRYTDKDDNNRVAVEVIVDQVSFTGSKSSAPRNAAPPQVQLSPEDFEEIVVDGDTDLPFADTETSV